MRYKGCSITDRSSKHALIVAITQIDLEAVARLNAQIAHERLVSEVCNCIPKPEKWGKP